MRWFTADLHLGHKRIIELCDRPFDDVDHMNTEIIERINLCCSSDDTLYILGDVAFGPVLDNLKLLRQVNCNIRIVSGNHDKTHLMHKNYGKRFREYFEATGAQEIIPGDTTLVIGGRPVVISHFPYDSSEYDREQGRELKYAQYRPKDHGEWILHGHVHDLWQQKGRMINVGVDAWAFWPVPETEIIFRIKEEDREYI